VICLMAQPLVNGIVFYHLINYGLNTKVSNGKHNYFPIMIERPKDKWKVSKEFKKTDIIKSNGETEYKTYKHWYPKNILQYSNANATNEKPLHSTQKPLELIKYLIKTYSNEDDVVMDNCMGSNTTGLACKELNRQYIGIEKDKYYYDVSVGRVLS
jgi:DNA modification methylase